MASTLSFEELPVQVVAAATASVLLLSSLVLFHTPTQRMVETWKARLLQSSKPLKDEGSSSPKVTNIFIHPVKSCRPLAVTKTYFDGNGLDNDRLYMLVVDAPLPPGGRRLFGQPTHQFLSQRQAPKLATVTAYKERDLEKNEMVLKLSAKGHETVKILVKLSEYGDSIKARLWGSVVVGVDMGVQAAKFFADVTGEPSVKLIRVTKPLVSDDRYVPPVARTLLGKPPTATFTDGFPVLIACEESLKEVNRRLKEKGEAPIPMSRFRPNIVISGTAKPFDEDEWKRIKIGTVTLHLVKGCPRCKQSCTDQLTGKVHDQPLKVMREFRAFGGDDVYFGQNAIATGGVGPIYQGMPIEILERGEPVWEKKD